MPLPTYEQFQALNRDKQLAKIYEAMSAPAPVTINAGDIRIGGVELQDANTGDRAKIDELNLLAATDIGLGVADPILAALVTAGNLNLASIQAKLPAVATRTQSIITVAADGTVAAGAKYIGLIFSPDFTGTVDLETFSGATDQFLEFPLLGDNQTYASLAYTRTAGTIRIVTIV